ncbi:ATPase [Halarchaeum grantii]|uniref:histidine kinase n=1 Tax=Halarchaeum grantii TaxID=1193105 RepID=A0A830EWP8_9EURY|nr:PAS domain S-box protein [Halarchaeum grantii]GGL38187.1 ATPase [Halarchaeum grantii]
MTDRSGPISVLCVDGEPDMAALVGERVARADDRITTTVATSARAGLTRLEAGDVDCVVSGFDMPGMDGIEFLEAVRATHPDLPFVLFTAGGSEAVASDAISAGATDYVRRDANDDPYATLARRVRAAVDQYRARPQTAASPDVARTVLEASPDAILVGVDGDCVFANAAAVDQFGAADADALRGRSMTALLGSADAADEHATEASVTWERRTIRALDGTAFPAEVTRRAVSWGGRDATVGIVRALAERVSDTHERVRYRTAFEQAMDAMVIADDDGTYVEANRSAVELFGLPRAELLGSHVSDFAPADYDFATEWEGFKRGGLDRGTFPLLRPDGERRAVEYAATAEIAPGEHLSVLRDVTERERLEEQLLTERDTLREIYEIIATREMGFETKIRRLLDVGREFLGVPYGFLTEIDGDTQHIVAACGDHELLQPGESCPLSEAYCRETVTRAELVTVQNAVAEGLSDDPAYERFELGCYVGSKILVNGELYGTFCFAGTEPRANAFSEAERTFVELLAQWVSYELERDQVTAELEAQNERLEEFASMVSHDLRSPLSVAQGYLELAREDGDPEQFDRVRDAHERMGRLIDDLLYLAREGEEIGETEPVPLREAVERAWATVEDGSSAALAVGDDLGTVVADPARLQQLLENLFSNAIEHGGPDVTVRVTALEGGFAVTDDGPGIPADLREEVFERGVSTVESGSGFGLHIVREIVGGHGWRVDVTDGPEGGARFEITGVDVT